MISLSSCSYKCAVCDKPTYSFNYAVLSCNACKMFFRRCRNLKTPIEPCRTNGNCGDLVSCCWNENSRNSTTPKPASQLTPILQNLIYLDADRHQTFSTYLSMENPGLDDVILSNSITFIEKTSQMKPDFYDWATMDQISAIIFMKRFSFINWLSPSELKSFVKNSYIQFIMLCNAMRSVGLKSDTVGYPDDVDIFPEEIRQMYTDCSEKLLKIHFMIVARLIELKITKEEFVLLGAIIICDPAFDCTEANRNRISQYQKIYSSTFLEYCQHRYQKSGPSRFIDILSICFTINRTFVEFGEVLMMFDNEAKIKKLFTDFFAFVLNKRESFGIS
ncbi:hypothetical protein GCK72_020749 [Caenorhabditis remanei]|uniref:Uncharacterized protein n=1 Tax=Caenorhabditis remanei TaxID=31234 RepID=A0A6A5GID7_CAERE|nr:hypothetical protein GCK72_020749 [Caenorhabditis remanei]KAF1754189.1 hypothetical protein GCK72_020749 [Caenorhabditis remanei]